MKLSLCLYLSADTTAYSWFSLSLQTDPDSSLDEEQESHIIINAVKSANIPKFVSEDVPLFEGILEDLFPGITPPQLDNRLLQVMPNIGTRR